MRSIQLIFLLGVLFFSALSSANEVLFTEIDEDIVNPDRGFYYPYTTSTSAFEPLVLSDLVSRRENAYTPFQATYQVKSSIALRHYVLDSYVNVDQLQSSFLSQIQTDFDTARAAGVRLILRFSYTITPNPGSCSAGFICPPYGDAPKARVLSHISQLAPLLSANSDVILGLQQGFIGTWGENYYTDYFGDASVNDQGYLTNQNWNDRNEVVAALLQALPVTRMLQLRYPQAKQRYLLGPDAALSSPGMSSNQSFDQTDQARLGFHNDCFLASEDDFGTFADYGNDASPVSSGNSLLLKDYAKNDGAFTLVGGETCSDAFSPQNNCESDSGRAIEELESNHYSYLNSDYNNLVNNDWAEGMCLEEIKRRLGYRLVLTRADVPSQVNSGQALTLKIELTNTGFAAPVNPRQLWLVMRNKQSNAETRYLLDGQNTDPQRWLAGSSQQIIASPVMQGLTAGSYSLWLHLIDSSNNEQILNRAEFSIRFANEGTWESSTGYNNLMATVEIGGETVENDDGDILRFLPAIISGSNK